MYDENTGTALSVSWDDYLDTDQHISAKGTISNTAVSEEKAVHPIRAFPLHMPAPQSPPQLVWWLFLEVA